MPIKYDCIWQTHRTVVEQKPVLLRPRTDVVQMRDDLVAAAQRSQPLVASSIGSIAGGPIARAQLAGGHAAAVQRRVVAFQIVIPGRKREEKARIMIGTSVRRTCE